MESQGCAKMRPTNVLASDPKEGGTDSKQIRHDQNEVGVKSSVGADMFPWILEYREQCRSLLARQSPSSLIKLIRFFNRNVSSNISDCYKKSSRAAKLKELIKEALLLFMYFYRFEQPQDQNRAVYLEQMSDLLAMYIDLELVASKRDAEPQQGKISARLVSCLYVYLENSTEHMLDSLIKVQLMNKMHSDILDALISKIFKIIPAHPESEVMYVRYLLVYRLWKKIHSNLAVKKQINANAISSLRNLPNLPTSLLEQVLTMETRSPGESPSTKFYLCQHLDMRRACDQFLRYCRPTDKPDGDIIIERDPRLNLTETNLKQRTESEDSINNNKFHADSVKLFTSSIGLFNNQRFSTSRAHQEILSSNKIKVISNSVNKYSPIRIVNTISFSKEIMHDCNNPILTNLYNKRKKPKQLIDILSIDSTDEKVPQNVECKIRQKIGYLEDVKPIMGPKIKVTSRNGDQTTQKMNNIFPNVESPELESKLLESPILSEDDTDPENKTRLANPIEPIKSSPLDSTASKYIYRDNEIISFSKANSEVIVEQSVATVVTSSKALRLETEEANEKAKISALHDIEVLSKDKQPADSTVSSVEMLKDTKSLNEDAVVNCSVIRATDSIVAAAAPVAQDVEPKKLIEIRHVNSNATKTEYYPNEEKVQQALITERNSLPNINESHPYLDEQIKEKEDKIVNSEETLAKLGLTQINEVSETKCSEVVHSNSKQYQSDSSELPTTSNDFYDIPESDIDDLTLLASVSAQQRISVSKKTEYKLKSYSGLPQNPENDNQGIVNQIVGTYADDVQDLVDNDKTNPIFNGETVMLLQKSIKMNYNSDDDDTINLAKPECCYQSLILKHDPYGVSLHTSPTKPNPDYVKSNEIIQEPSKKYEILYSGYSVPLPSSCCTHPNVQHSSNRPVHYHQMPDNLSATHTTQSVQTKTTVQEKCNSKKAELTSRLCDDHLEKVQQNNKQLQHGNTISMEEEKDIANFKHVDSTLPLKKRLKAQRMSLNRKDRVLELAGKEADLQSGYPGTLMMSIADVDMMSVTTNTIESTKRRGYRETATNAKISNQNIPNCFPRKNNGRNKNFDIVEREMENSGASAPKKSRKSSCSDVKQTRSSRRVVPTVNYAYPDFDHEWTLSGKRKRKRRYR